MTNKHPCTGCRYEEEGEGAWPHHTCEKPVVTESMTPEQKIVEDCKHSFWADCNPPGCLDCGYSKEELIYREIKNKMLQDLLNEGPKCSCSNCQEWRNLIDKKISE